MCEATSQVPESPMQSNLGPKAGNSLDVFRILTTFKIVGNHRQKDIFNQLFTHLMIQLDHKTTHLPLVLMILKRLPIAFLCWLRMRHYEGIRDVSINPRADLLFHYFPQLRQNTFLLVFSWGRFCLCLLPWL